MHECQRCKTKFDKLNHIKIVRWGGGEWRALLCSNCTALLETLFKEFMLSEN